MNDWERTKRPVRAIDIWIYLHLLGPHACWNPGWPEPEYIATTIDTERITELERRQP